MTDTITIGSFSCSKLTAQPFAYEGEAGGGLTSRMFRVTGLLTPTQWQALVSEYTYWRNNRINDADTLYSGTVGTTVSLTITSANGISVTHVACWFRTAPEGRQIGAYIDASADLVDAAQALAVLQKEIVKGQQNAIAKELQEASARISALTSGTTLADLKAARALAAVYDRYLAEDLPDLGTVTLGGVTIKLLRPMTTYSDGPQVGFSAGGKSFITGPLKAHETRRVEGIITAGTYDSLLSWYSSAVTTSPTTDTWFPTAPPSATAEKFLVSGVVTTRYTVSLEVKKII